MDEGGNMEWIPLPALTCLSAMTPAAEQPIAMTSQGRKDSKADDRRLTPNTLLK